MANSKSLRTIQQSFNFSQRQANDVEILAWRQPSTYMGRAILVDHGPRTMSDGYRIASESESCNEWVCSHREKEELTASSRIDRPYCFFCQVDKVCVYVCISSIWRMIELRSTTSQSTLIICHSTHTPTCRLLQHCMLYGVQTQPYGASIP